jgi:DNA-binding NarL/FixJ family response regulator
MDSSGVKYSAMSINILHFVVKISIIPIFLNYVTKGTKLRFKYNFITPRNPPSSTGLPDGNGVRLTRRIKKEHPGIRIAPARGHDLPEYRQAAAQSGADRLFVKDPMNCHEVASFMDRQMSHRRFLQTLKVEACETDNLKKTRYKYLFQGA